MGVADQQLVEIAKAVVGEFGVLIMDEPTSALNLEEVERLFGGEATQGGWGRDPLRLSPAVGGVRPGDRVTVVRDGSRIFTRGIAETDVGEVIRAMLGSKSSLVADVAEPARDRASGRRDAPGSVRGGRRRRRQPCGNLPGRGAAR